MKIITILPIWLLLITCVGLAEATPMNYSVYTASGQLADHSAQTMLDVSGKFWIEKSPVDANYLETGGSAVTYSIAKFELFHDGQLYYFGPDTNPFVGIYIVYDHTDSSATNLSHWDLAGEGEFDSTYKTITSHTDGGDVWFYDTSWELVDDLDYDILPYGIRLSKGASYSHRYQWGTLSNSFTLTKLYDADHLPPSVPEPPTIFLLGTVLAGLGGFGFRSKIKKRQGHD